jgi:hypothetical protein
LGRDPSVSRGWEKEGVTAVGWGDDLASCWSEMDEMRWITAWPEMGRRDQYHPAGSPKPQEQQEGQGQDWRPVPALNDHQRRQERGHQHHRDHRQSCRKKKATCYYQGKSGFGFIGEFYALVGDLSSNNDSKI